MQLSKVIELTDLNSTSAERHAACAVRERQAWEWERELEVRERAVADRESRQIAWEAEREADWAVRMAQREAAWVREKTEVAREAALAQHEADEKVKKAERFKLSFANLKFDT